MGFTSKELNSCAEGKKLLGLGLELTRRCNLSCVYCYSNAGRPLHNELSLDEIIKVIEEAIQLGVKKIGIIGGGEPLLYEHLKGVIEFISKNNVKLSLFTNGTLINSDWANYFYKKRISIVHKLNSFKKDIQDSLCASEGAFDRIMKSLELLNEAGYPDESHDLRIETVVLKDNMKEIPSIWRWAREIKIVPVVERITPQGRGQKLTNLCSSADIKSLFEELSKIDSTEFDIDWRPHPPIAGTKGCRLHLYALYITSNGEIQPCSGVTISLGNVREVSLSTAISSNVVKDLRNIKQKIKGKCRGCELNEICYGCRGAAFQFSGDYLAEDPFCWMYSSDK